MFKAAGERRNEVRKNLRGGPGDILFSHMFEPDEMLDKCTTCAVLTVEPGCGIGEHPHAPEAEIYVLLEGELDVTDNGAAKVMKPGDAMFTGGGGTHSVMNNSNQTAKLLAVIVR